MKVEISKSLKEIGWAFISKVNVFLFYYLIQYFFIKLMDVEQWGKWSFFMSTLNVITLCSTLGINNSIQKYIAQYSGTSDFKDVLKSSMKLRIIGSVIFIVCFVLLIKPFLIAINREGLSKLFFLSIPYVFFFGMVDFFNFVFQGYHRLKYNAYLKFFEHGLKFVFTIVLFSLIQKLSIIVVSFNISFLLSSLVCVFVFYNVIYKKAQGTNSKSYLKEIFYYSIPQLIMVLGAYISIEIDTIMLNIMKGDYETAVYSTAKQIVRQLPHISFAISIGIMPIFAKMDEQNKEKLKRKFDKWFYINFGLVAFVVLSILVLSPLILPWLFDHKYDASILPLQILSPYLLFNGISVFTALFLDYRGLAKKRAVNLFITIILNIVLNYFLIQKYGAVGASISTTISFIPYFLLNLYEVKRVFRK